MSNIIKGRKKKNDESWKSFSNVDALSAFRAMRQRNKKFSRVGAVSNIFAWKNSDFVD